MARTTLGGMGLGFQRRNLPSPGGIRTIQRTVLVSCHIRDSEFSHRHLHGSTVVAVAAKLPWRVALKSRDTAFATGKWLVVIYAEGAQSNVSATLPHGRAQLRLRAEGAGSARRRVKAGPSARPRHPRARGDPPPLFDSRARRPRPAQSAQAAASAPVAKTPSEAAQVDSPTPRADCETRTGS